MEIADYLKEAGATEIFDRPWGKTWSAPFPRASGSLSAKRLLHLVNPGEIMAAQTDQFRSSYFRVVDGSGLVLIGEGGTPSRIDPNGKWTSLVPPNVMHQLGNNSSTNSLLLEQWILGSGSPADTDT